MKVGRHAGLKIPCFRRAGSIPASRIKLSFVGLEARTLRRQRRSAGSIPTRSFECARVAKTVKAQVCKTCHRGFDSHRALEYGDGGRKMNDEIMFFIPGPEYWPVSGDGYHAGFSIQKSRVRVLHGPPVLMEA